MIPINYNRLSDYEKSKIISKYYSNLIFKKNKKKITEIDTWCKKNLIINGITYNFEMIVKAEFSTLMLIKEYIDNNSLDQTQISYINKNRKRKYYIIETLYKDIDRVGFTEILNVSVCPYCNRNYVNSLKNRTTCQLDHFFDKSRYPIFAVSFYNLIPVCSICNHLKSTNELDYCPSNSNVNPLDLVTFSINILNNDYLRNSSGFDIVIEYDKKIKKNIETLKLNELYQIHKDYVQEILIKKRNYSDGFINSMHHSFPELFSSKEDVIRTYFGNYFSSDELFKRSLSKLSYDLDLVKDIL